MKECGALKFGCARKDYWTSNVTSVIASREAAKQSHGHEAPALAGEGRLAVISGNGA